MSRKPELGDREPRTRRAQIRRGEKGNTLVEVLLALTIIGFTAQALLGTLVNAASSSAQHQSLASIDTVMKSYVETAKYDIELQPAPWFTSCAPITSSSYAGNSIPSTAPIGYSISIASIQYWNGSAFVSSCPGSDHGYQLLNVIATGPNSVTQTISLAIRNPNYAP